MTFGGDKALILALLILLSQKRQNGGDNSLFMLLVLAMLMPDLSNCRGENVRAGEAG